MKRLQGRLTQEKQPHGEERGSIIPELCWLVATLLLAMLFIVPTVRHYDGQINDRLNQLISLRP